MFRLINPAINFTTGKASIEFFGNLIEELRDWPYEWFLIYDGSN